MVEKREEPLAKLEAALVRGVVDADADRGRPAGEVFDRLEAKYKAMICPES
jgi:antitoxin ParD1/3/4